jgi:hypothetical protein
VIKRRGAVGNDLGTMIKYHNKRHAEVLCRMRRRHINGFKKRQRRRKPTANDSSSPKVYRRESFLATVQIKPVQG